MRFCWYPRAASRTPRRYHCEPDETLQKIDAHKAAMLESETRRVRPRFSSTRYGYPAYCQLAPSCPPEISGGADDQSEMGVFHDLYQPQRLANLTSRLRDFTPAGNEAEIFVIT